MNKKLLALGVLIAGLSLQTAKGSQDTIVRSLRDQLHQTERANVRTGSGFVEGSDVTSSVHGLIKSEYVRQHHLDTLNKELPSEYGFFNNRLELDANVAYGAEKYGTPAVEFAAKLRQEYQAGRFDKSVKTKATQIKLGDAVLDIPGAGIDTTVPWMKHLWLKASLNALTGRNAQTDHTIQAGLFDHVVGRGIAYGPFYGTQKKYLGVFRASNKFAPFGIKLAGDLVKDRISYALYFGRLEEKSADFDQTFNRNMAQVVGRRETPASGVGKANDVLSAQVMVHYDSLSLGDIKSEYYFVYNDASNQQVEIANDSKSELATLGSALEYENGNFEFGYDMALNFGHQDVYAIDRNVIALAATASGDTTGVCDSKNVVTHLSTISPTNSHVTVAGAGNATNAAIKALVDGYDGNENSLVLGTTTIGTSTTAAVINSATRYRAPYKNTYAGWMAVADMSYNWKAANTKLSIAAGHASGDVNPHDSATDKRYHGFIGLNENYAGKRVKSVLVLNGRMIQRPHINNDGKVLIDNSFTDLTFVGGGIDWRLSKKDINVGINVLGFFKDKVGNKLGTEQPARRFMGTEANVCFEWQLLPGLALAGQAALFLPGPYYKDIKGTQLGAAIVDSIDKSDRTGYAQAVPTLGNDTGYHFNLGVQYKF